MTGGRKRLLRSAALAGALGVFARLAAAASGILLAYRFGAGMETDAYLVARAIPVGIYLILDSVLYNALVPILRREDAPESLFRTALIIAVAVAVCLTGALWFGAPYVIDLLAPGAESATRHHAAILQRVTALAVLLAVPASCLKAWNASRDRYVMASLDGCTISGLLLATLVFAPEDTGVLPITIALPAAFLLLAGAQGWQARKLFGHAPRHVPLATFPWRDFRRPMAPLLALNAAQQAQVWAAVMLATGFGAGSVSQLHYSYGIAQIPVGVIDLVLFSTLFPFAAGLAAQNDRARLASICRAATSTLLILGVPLALWLALSREVIVDALLLRGVFDAADGRMTAALLLGHAAAVPGWCLEALGCRLLFALDRHGRYLGIVLFRVALFLALSAVLLPLLGLPGLSIAFAVAFSASAVFALLVVRRELSAGSPRAGSGRLRPGIFLLGGSMAMAVGFWGLQSLLAAFPVEDPLYRLGVHGILAGLILVCAAWGVHRNQYFIHDANRQDDA